MKRRGSVATRLMWTIWGLTFVLLVLSLARSAAAAAPPTHDLDGIDRTARTAFNEGKYPFCSHPNRPLVDRGQELCALAEELDECEGLRAACADTSREADAAWLIRLAELLGPIAKIFVYLFVVGAVIVVAIPVLRMLLRLRRDQNVAKPSHVGPSHAVVIPKAEETAEADNADAMLQLADEHHTRGELERALDLYLVAALVALDRRGAIRIARHRTNGEYVRGCTEEAARPRLREIVREADTVQFGKCPPNPEAVARVSSSAKAIVRWAAQTAAIGILAAAALGCGNGARGGDPAGDELPIDVLRRNGFTVGSLATSLATMPIPGENDGAPVVIVDLERVPLDAEAEAHMMRWVEGGGVLVLFGNHGWPASIAPQREHATTHDLTVRTGDPNGGLEDIDSEEENEASVGAPIEITGARTARSDAFSWREPASVGDKSAAQAIAFLGEHTYAAKKHIGRGMVLGIANDDLFTNVGVRPRRNAAALVTLLRAASHDPWRRLPMVRGRLAAIGDLRIARPEDGIPPPANPFAALIAAGLAKGSWHALVAAILLFLGYGIRHARPLKAARESRRAFAEHVEATGAFYGEAKAYSHALGAYGRFLDLRLREILPRGADPAAFLALRSGVPSEHVAKIYARALAAKPDGGAPPSGDELAVLEELRQIAERAIPSNEKQKT